MRRARKANRQSRKGLPVPADEARSVERRLKEVAHTLKPIVPVMQRGGPVEALIIVAVPRPDGSLSTELRVTRPRGVPDANSETGASSVPPDTPADG